MQAQPPTLLLGVPLPSISHSSLPEAATGAPQRCLVADRRGDLPEHFRQKVQKVPRWRFNRFFRHSAQFDERVYTESTEFQKADRDTVALRGGCYSSLFWFILNIANVVGDGGDGGFTLSRMSRIPVYPRTVVRYIKACSMCQQSMQAFHTHEVEEWTLTACTRLMTACHRSATQRECWQQEGWRLLAVGSDIDSRYPQGEEEASSALPPRCCTTRAGWGQWWEVWAAV